LIRRLNNMKYFLIIMTLITMVSIFKTIIHIGKLTTAKEIIDKTIADKMKTPTDKKCWKVAFIIIMILPLLYILLCANFINTFIFSIVCFAYATWSIYDANDWIKYVDKNIISKTLDSKIYKLISIPIDLSFAIYMLYQLFLKW